MFNITERGLDAMTLSHTSTKSTPLAEYTQNLVDDRLNKKSWTDFDWVLALASKGWSYKQEKPNKKCKPYEPDGAKVWFYHSVTAKGGINSKYLQVLFDSQSLFDKGLKQIFHHQLKSYYVALLTVPASALNSVQPWQPKSFYTLLLQMYKRGKPKGRRGNDLNFEDDEGMLCNYSQSFFIDFSYVRCPRNFIAIAVVYYNYNITSYNT